MLVLFLISLRRGFSTWMRLRFVAQPPDSEKSTAPLFKCSCKIYHLKTRQCPRKLFPVTRFVEDGYNFCLQNDSAGVQTRILSSPRWILPTAGTVPERTNRIDQARHRFHHATVVLQGCLSDCTRPEFHGNASFLLNLSRTPGLDLNEIRKLLWAT